MSDEPVRVDEQKVIGADEVPASATREEAEQQQALHEYSKKNKVADGTMRVHVHSPFHDYFDGLASSLSAENATGPFDILPRHHNFISLLKPCEVVIRTLEHGNQKIRISGGILHVKADAVSIFLDV
jgi:hypothetical protein